MGLFTLAGAGFGLIIIGTYESVTSKNHTNSTTLISILTLSLLVVFNSLFSISDALSQHDSVGSALQLQISSIGLLFFLYSILGLTKHHTKILPLPFGFLNLVSFFAFFEEFMIFYIQRKDATGIENRYYDLMLLPVGICVVSAVVGCFVREGMGTRLARGIGLVMQGMWFVQMGFSFFSDWIVDGCFLDQKSRGNYTVRCKGQMAYHRGRGIATLQFNCHLAVLVVFVVGVYALFAERDGGHGGGQSREYRPIGGDLQLVSGHGGGQFSLGSDEDDDDDEIEVVENGMERKGVVLEMGSNGFGPHQ